MDPSVIVAIALGTPAAIISYLAFRSASQANKAQAQTQEKAIDSEAFERARKIYQDAIATLNEQVTQFREQVKQMDTELGQLHEKARDLETQVRRLRASNERLEASNQRLELEIAGYRGN